LLVSVARFGWLSATGIMTIREPKIAEKRRIYARLLSVIPIALQEALEGSPKDNRRDKDQLLQGLAEAVAAADEVLLICSNDVGSATVNIMSLLTGESLDDINQQYASLWIELRRLMRIDLGELPFAFDLGENSKEKLTN
jgi:hypothetical protein